MRPAIPSRHRPAAILPLAAILLGSLALSATGQVVLNEILYHPPRDRDGLQFIELWNSGTNPTDIGGWSFSRGVRFTFPKGTRLAPGSFVLVCSKRSEFTDRYGSEVPLAGEFEGKLSHGGERIELKDATGNVVDSVTYSDREPWPLAADGGSSSLERICPFAPGTNAANWAPSNLPKVRAPAGTPGKTNDSFSRHPLPVIRDVTRLPESPEPRQPVVISALVQDTGGITNVVLLWSVANAESTGGSEQRLIMDRRDGDAHAARYQATIPPQPEGRLVRYRVIASNSTGAERVAPSTNDLRPAWSFATFLNTNKARLPIAFLLQGESSRGIARTGPLRRSSLFGNMGLSPARGDGTLIFLPAGGGPARVFDFIQITPRSGGRKVRLLKDQALDGMTTVNVILESPRSALCEVLAYDLYAQAGVPAPRAEHWRVWLDGQPQGYQLAFEQVNKSFLARHGRDDSGHLYKLIWYGSGVVGQHEKKTDLEGDHSDLLGVLDGLNSTQGAAQWEFIAKHFNVTNFINYYAVNMCIQNWDGFFNNYFTYHDTGGSGQWEIYPWDEDKTWGYYDGRQESEPWYTMPLSFGMNGDQPPGTRARPGAPSPRFRGGTLWWRAPGWFSGPLLANPEFRRRFLVRLREMTQTLFTRENLFPRIAAMEQRLEPEMRGAGALAQFRQDIQSFRDQVIHRRQFLITELEKELKAK